MKISENITLAPFTTFKIGGPASFFCRAGNDGELVEAVKFAKDKDLPILVIGSGSNLLISDQGYKGLVIRNEIMGVEIESEAGSQKPEARSRKREENKTQNAGVSSDSQLRAPSSKSSGSKLPASSSFLITAGAGEDWEKLVERTVGMGLYGMENLSAIPGTVGASPIQNIGAYGVDVSKVIHSVRALDTKTMDFVELSNADCRFAYRDSRFKHEKGRYIISAVTYALSKEGRINIDYKDVREYFDRKNIAKPTLAQVRQAVTEVRRNKLPDWTCWGTAGSFFKNPIIDKETFAALKKKYPDLPGFPEPDGRVKVSLAWILDKLCDARGLTIGNVGTFEKQALVVVAKPGASAKEVLDFAHELMRRVREKTGIEIEGEVEWVVA